MSSIIKVDHITKIKNLMAFYLEADRNQNCKALTRNLPGIRYPGSVPGSPYFELTGSCFGSCLQPFSIFLVTPGSRGLIPGKDQEVPGIWPGSSWF